MSELAGVLPSEPPDEDEPEDEEDDEVLSPCV